MYHIAQTLPKPTFIYHACTCMIYKCIYILDKQIYKCTYTHMYHVRICTFTEAILHVHAQFINFCIYMNKCTYTHMYHGRICTFTEAILHVHARFINFCIHMNKCTYTHMYHVAQTLQKSQLFRTYIHT